MKRILGVFTMLLLTIAGAWADDYNPQNPPDPNPLFQLTVSVSPSEAGYVSGGGRYKEGQQVRLSTSRRDNYDFQYWECDGVQVSDQASFYYTMPQKSVNLVAVYAYNPTNPQDPTTANSYRLYVESNLEGSCTFNLTSGAKQNANQYISVSAQNVSPGFKFLGWYEKPNPSSVENPFDFESISIDSDNEALSFYSPSYLSFIYSLYHHGLCMTSFDIVSVKELDFVHDMQCIVAMRDNISNVEKFTDELIFDKYINHVVCQMCDLTGPEYVEFGAKLMRDVCCGELLRGFYIREKSGNYCEYSIWRDKFVSQSFIFFRTEGIEKFTRLKSADLANTYKYIDSIYKRKSSEIGCIIDWEKMD